MKRLPYYILAIIFLLNSAMSCDDELEPVYFKLTGIGAYNINNEGEFPFVTEKAVKKEAYMIGIKWIADGNDNLYRFEIQGSPEIKIFCNADFDEQHAAGSDITSYFKPARYLPEKISEGLALLKVPAPGKYSFKVKVFLDDGDYFEYDTPLIDLY